MRCADCGEAVTADGYLRAARLLKRCYLSQTMAQHRELVNPQRNWKSAAYQLVSLAVLIGTLLHFTRHDMLSG